CSGLVDSISAAHSWKAHWPAIDADTGGRSGLVESSLQLSTIECFEDLRSLYCWPAIDAASEFSPATSVRCTSPRLAMDRGACQQSTIRSAYSSGLLRSNLLLRGWTT
ncbi:hypothetical protein KFL_008790010, partial [Klebsormidium nitens]